MKNHPSRLLIKLVKGNPSEEFKSMLGNYKIIAQKTWRANSVPVFIHDNHSNQRLIFSPNKNCWIFEKDYETVFTWSKEKDVFNDECWSKPNGIAILNFTALKKFTFRIIPY